ncbi:MAG TPA: hypothetical protein VGN86_09135 [Pyrinomonadaceae bacterium]|nr:hypothetical protein [Pyrinomonadaceae bacterium]
MVLFAFNLRVMKVGDVIEHGGAAEGVSGFVRALLAKPQTGKKVSLKIMSKSLLTILFLLVAISGVSAQTEADLKQYFEGKHVISRIDMPATKDGVSVYPERAQPMNFGEYGNRLKQHGVAVRRGEEIMITRIKLKDKHIEFHLGGGGYGTFGDDTDTSAHTSTVGKSHREKELEDEIKRESDPQRKRKLKDRLDDVRRDRERENDVRRAIAEDEAETRRARIEQKALQGGSRFNIYFTAIDSQILTPQTIMRALREYVDFNDRESEGDVSLVSPASYNPTELRRPQSTVVSVGPRSTYLQEGLKLGAVLKVLGQPDAVSQRSENGKVIVSYEFIRGGGRTVVAEFVNDVLVHSQIVVVDEVKRGVAG